MPETLAPSAPAAPVSIPAPQAVARNFNDTINAVAGKTSIPATPEPVQEVVKIVPAAQAQPDAPGSTDLPPGSVPAVAPEAVAPDAEAPAEPTGEIALDDDGITLRAERNADGTFKTKLDPTHKLDLEIKDKQTGEIKKYTKTIPEILRLAKDGVALQPIVQQLKPEVEHYRKNLPVWEKQFSDLETQLADQQALNRELLTGEEHLVVQRREEYAREMSPDKRLERENAELRRDADRFKRLTESQRVAAKRDAFMASSGISAALGVAESKLGAEVVAGKLAMATQPLMVNGVIPPERWPVVEQYIKGPFQQWVAAEVTKKDTQSREAALAKKATDEAQRQAQSSVNSTARNLVPVGRAAPDAPPELPKPKNAQDAISRMVNRPLPPTVAGVG